MGRFTVIPQDTFEAMQLDAGILLNTFDPDNIAAPADEDIITATTGGLTIACTPTYSDLGEDVDNVPNNTKELKHLDGWDCSISTTALGTSAELIKMSLGAADNTDVSTYTPTSDTALVTGKTYYTRSGAGTDQSPYTYSAVDTPSASNLSSYYEKKGAYKVSPRADLKQSDFKNHIWWVGDRADGGAVAVKLKNALSTAGFSLQTSKNGKGQTSLTISGHVSINAQNEVPMEFYSIDP